MEEPQVVSSIDAPLGLVQGAVNELFRLFKSPGDDVSPALFYAIDEGRMDLAPINPEFLNSPETKDLLAALIYKKFTDGSQRPYFAAFVSSAWMVKEAPASSEEDLQERLLKIREENKSLKDDKRRVECVQVSAVTREQVALAICPFDRFKKHPPRQRAWELFKDESMEGRFIHAIRQALRPSSAIWLPRGARK